jgi:hypothetical protein
MKRGRKEGYCIIKYINDDEFQGTFVNDMANGKGIYIFSNQENEKVKGIWKDGKFVDYSE